MTEAIVPSRRGFITGLASLLIAAPAIVKATNIMPVKTVDHWLTVVPQRHIYGGGRSGGKIWAMDQITREAVRMFRNTNLFLQEIDKQYREDYAFVGGEQWPDEFRPQGAKTGDQPNPLIPDKLALAAAAVAVAPVVLKTPVTRRFWSLPQHSAASEEE